MATQIRADASQLVRLAGTYLDESRRLGDTLRGVQTFVTPPATAFGDTAGGARLRQANDELTELTGLAVERLVEVLEGDVDRLYRLARLAEQAEQQARATQSAAGGVTPW
jgi:hypothetical protein